MKTLSKTKLKQLQWDKIPETELTHSLWTKLDDLAIDEEKLVDIMLQQGIFEEIETMFGVNISASTQKSKFLRISIYSCLSRVKMISPLSLQKNLPSQFKKKPKQSTSWTLNERII